MANKKKKERKNGKKRVFEKDFDDFDETDEEDEHLLSFIHPDTKKSIIAILFFVLAILLLLSAFSKAGPAGNYVYQTFSYLFGIGYYLFPTISLIIASSLIANTARRLISPTILGGLLFIIAGLGIIDIISPESGGLIGSLIGFIETPFGAIASLIILFSITIIALLITLNIPLRFPSFRSSDTDKDDEEEDIYPDDLMEEDEDQEPKNLKEKLPKESSLKAESLTSGKIKTSNSEVLTPKVKINFKNYVPPPLSLLKSSSEKATAGDLRANANIIKRTFEGFNIPVEMAEINVGPKVTRYTLKPAEGVKLSKITSLHQDLALALAAHPIRMEAPIPGKSLVGIEVPNKTAAIVRLANLINTKEFNELNELGIVIGRDVTGEPIGINIDKMPHLLIAGATGSGKSVTLHSIIVSLLYKNSPETLRFIFIDPKRVELTVYENIPHLISPVIVQNKKAVGVFRWAISEMEKRYQMLQDVGARDIKSYNDKISKQPDGIKMPFIIIVIDELADLMSSYGKEVEGYIVRLSQMARAVGLHLILATQRPSVEIITGLIKANITARVALKVASQIDSRTILDSSGAEKLLGHGDMLVTTPTYSKPIRVQGSLITEDEIYEISSFIKNNNTHLTTELQTKVSPPEFEAENGNNDFASDKQKSVRDHSDSEDLFDQFENDREEDDLLPEAINLVRQSQKASASMLQRRLKVGYARAARLLDIMEEKGIVGPGSGAKPREILIDPIPGQSMPNENDDIDEEEENIRH